MNPGEATVMVDHRGLNLLITGGAGFIGVNLVQYFLKQKKYKISVLDNLSSGNYQLLERIARSCRISVEDAFSRSPDTLWFVKGDIRDRAVVNDVIARQGFIVHLAAQAGVILSIENPGEDADINIMGTLNLLESAVKHNIGKFIFASSAAPLGEQEPPLDEAKVPLPLSPYGASKLAAEAYCSAFHGSFGLPTVVLRFSNVYGPHSYHKGSVIAHFIKRILTGEHLVIYGDGEQTRDFLYVEDICRIIHKILEDKSGKTSGEIFQLGTGTETSVNDLVTHLNKLVPTSVETRYEAERKGEIKRNYASPQKLFKTLGIKAETGLETGIAKTWQWFTENK
jgi:UDP-glucose 4-epimerase